MDEIKELQKRIRILEDIEAIKKLKAKYCRCNDNKQWDEIGDVFTKDCLLEVPPVVKIQGREEIVKFLSESLTPVIVVHQVHGAELEIISETRAKGVWGEYDGILDPRANSSMVGYGFYEEEYAKEDGQWRIKKEKINRIYTQTNMVYPGVADASFTVKGNLRK